MTASLRVLAGQLVIGGFSGPSLTPSYRAALSKGERGGAILFRRNLGGSLEDVVTLTRSINDAAPPHLPPMICVDQEGGRVTRLGSPVVRLPPMRALGRIDDEGLVHRAAKALGRELLALGFTMDFAPVLDVDTRAENPIIGDRSFGQDPGKVLRMGIAYATGLVSSGVLACGKHFPGHGDTTKDSHLDLPEVTRSRAELDAAELVPFRGIHRATCPAVMSAHVVYPALDASLPATLSRAIMHDLLRGELRYDGLAISDDLEMKAVADRFPIEESAVMAVRAGCDALLVCSNEDMTTRAYEALVRTAEADATFRARVEDASTRLLEARRRHPPKPAAPGGLSSILGSAESHAVVSELEARGAFA